MSPALTIALLFAAPSQVPAVEFSFPSAPAACSAASARAELFPHLGFEIPALQTFHEDEIALTFDDGPDPQGVTEGVLDALQRADVKAAFFVNTHAWDAPLTAAQRATLRRIHADGHVLGNHTATHTDHLGLLDDDRVLTELTTVEQVVQSEVPEAPPLTLARAPYGRPMYPHSPSADRQRVGALMGTRAVHVAWHIDPWDWGHSADEPDAAAQVEAAVVQALRAGQRGIVLLHSSQPWTRDALPGIIQAAREMGLRFVSVEELVQRKYGASSAELVQCHRAALGLE